MNYTKFSLKRGFSSLLLTLISLGIVLTGSVSHLLAQTPPISSCVLTPELLAGQGFSLSGQGFTLSGQGFSLSGQGFSLSGQGFSLSGQGFSLSGQAAIVAEIQSNPITPGQWLLERLPVFNGAANFNTVPTAILIVDDFGGYTFPVSVGRASNYTGIALPKSHGGEVMLAVLDSINAANNTLEPDLNIWIVPIDVSGAGVNYETNSLVPMLQNTVASLRTNYGVTHFVYNLSFGLIACQDPGDPANGIPAFDFHQTVAAVKQANTPGPKALTPILECVAYGGGSKYTAYFGYSNTNPSSVFIPVSQTNNFSDRTPQDQGQPRLFETGRQRNAFQVDFNGKALTWKLKGPDGIERTVVASSSSPRCTSVPTIGTLPITPVVNCVAVNPAGGFTARFGYENPNPTNSVAVIVRTGGSNKFTPISTDSGQTTTFLPGKHTDVFRINFASGNIVWTINSKSVTATAVATLCPSSNGIGIGDQLVNQGLASNMVVARLAALTQKVTNDPNLQPLRAFLQQKLALSANTSQPEQHVAIASAGNYRPWLGGQPLAPAAWPETIAVGATLDNTNNVWSFSQNAKVLAPGAGYPLFAILGPNTYGAGTSFAAPIFSTLVGVCATQPFGLQFDGINPPLTANTFSNSLISTANFAPLSCSVNHTPVANDQAVVTNEDVPVAIALTASDSDGGVLNFIMGTPSHGTLTGTAPNVTYTPSLDYNGTDIFTYQVCDAPGACDTAIVGITINAVNDAPIATDLTVTTDEDTPITITLSAMDVDSTGLVFAQMTPSTKGILSGVVPNLTYTPNLNANGADSFTYQSCDPQGACDTATVNITIVAVNDVPVANAQSIVTDEDVPVAITLSATDVDGDVLIFALVTPLGNGMFSGVTPNLIYTPNANFNGLDGFSYQACDPQGACASASVNITVNAVNDAPVATDLTVTTNEDTPIAITLSATDVDSIGLVFALVNPLSNGSFSGASPNLIYTPNANFSGVDGFSYQACDSQGACDTATVTITVSAVNDAPTCANVTPSVNFLDGVNHQMWDVQILGAIDVENDAVSLTITSIFQDEVVNGNGDGNTSPDAQGVGTAIASLRGERQGGSNGRVYHVRFNASDVWGSICQGEVLVRVAQDGSELSAIDDGALYDSTQP